MLKHDVKKHQDEQVQNNTSFVFRESMLDEFDIWRSQAEMVTADELVLVFGRLWDTLASAYLYILDQSSLKYICTVRSNNTNKNSEKKEKRKNPMSPAICHVSHATCHISCVVCHLSCVTCRMSPVTCHLSHVTCHLWGDFQEYTPLPVLPSFLVNYINWQNLKKIV